ncbi:MAG: DUF3298 and DUF4163 domain-containing protein [Lachnospiraceae bacterium]|nr:DUF3298 and DUF4163 domain-containing protein [Lachnospiraceae bacterium]
MYKVKKKHMAAAAALIMSAALMLSGCSAGNSADTAGSSTETAGEAAGSTEAAEAPVTKAAPAEVQSKSAPAAAEKDEAEETADNGSVKGDRPEYRIESESYAAKSEYFYGDFERVYITDDNHPVLKKAVDDYFTASRKDFDKMCKNYEAEEEEVNKEALASDDEFSHVMYYSCGTYCKVKRADSKVFSICIDEYSYTGGAHGTSYSYGVNFDTETGEILAARDIGDVAPTVEEYVLKTIEASGEEAEEGMFPEYKETVHSMLSKGMDEMAWWFDDLRLVTAFQQYDIAPYAAGILEFGVPCTELEGFNEKYLPDGDFAYVPLHDNGFADILDVDSDGKEDTVWIETLHEEDSYNDTFVLHKNDESKALRFEYYYSTSHAYVHSDSGDYLFITATTDNDWRDTEMYDAKTLRLIQEIEGGISNVDEEKLTVSTRQQALGTWGAEKDYSYGPDGITTDQDTYRINNNAAGDNRKSLTLLQDLDYHTEPGKENTETLKKGSKIYPVEIGKNEAGFETESGEKGYISFETDEEEGGIKVNGINENKLFDGIVYAG